MIEIGYLQSLLAVKFSQDLSSDTPEKALSITNTNEQRMRAIAYSLDALVPGLYIWCGPLRIRLWGCLPEKNYSGVIHSIAGVALVLPNYRIYSTYNGSYDPR